MKILLDECIPRKLKRSFPGHQCLTVPEAGFAGQSNGRLLTSAEAAGFDVFLTMDKGMQYQQNLAGRRIAILSVRAKSNRLTDLLPHVDACLDAMMIIRPRDIVIIGI